MDILNKIGRDEVEFLESFERLYANRFRNKKLKEAAKYATMGAKNYFGRRIQDVKITQPFVKYSPFLADLDSEESRHSILIGLELDKLVRNKIIDRSERKRIFKLVKAGGSSVDLAKVIVNNYRNKRLKKERNARKARL